MISLKSAVAATVPFTGCSVMSFEPIFCEHIPDRDASAKRDLIMVASGAENKVLAKSSNFSMAFAVGPSVFQASMVISISDC